MHYICHTHTHTPSNRKNVSEGMHGISNTFGCIFLQQVMPELWHDWLIPGVGQCCPQLQWVMRSFHFCQVKRNMLQVKTYTFHESLRSSGQQFSTLFEHLTDKLTNNKLIKTIIERLIDLKRLFHDVNSLNRFYISESDQQWILPHFSRHMLLSVE